MRIDQNIFNAVIIFQCERVIDSRTNQVQLKSFYLLKKKKKNRSMVFGLISCILNFNLNWLTEVINYVYSLGNNQGERIICRSRSAIEKLIVRQRNVATELTNTMSSAITSTDSLESTMNTHLPPGDTLSTTLSSPQFSQALSMFWSALQSGQAGPVVRQFGLGTDAINAAATGNLEDFVSALETETKSSSNTPTTTTTTTVADDDKNKDKPAAAAAADKKKDDEDDGMALD